MIPWWVWLLILIVVVILILIWIWKNVLVPAVNVNTDKPEYDRTEAAGITGDVSQAGTPLVGKTVYLAIEPPVGDAYVLPDAVTDSNGAFGVDPVITWEIPDDAPGGTYTLTATCLGVSAQKTFTQIQMGMLLRV